MTTNKNKMVSEMTRKTDWIPVEELRALVADCYNARPFDGKMRKNNGESMKEWRLTNLPFSPIVFAVVPAPFSGAVQDTREGEPMLVPVGGTEGWKYVDRDGNVVPVTDKAFAVPDGDRRSVKTGTFVVGVPFTENCRCFTVNATPAGVAMAARIIAMPTAQREATTRAFWSLYVECAQKRHARASAPAPQPVPSEPAANEKQEGRGRLRILVPDILAQHPKVVAAVKALDAAMDEARASLRASEPVPASTSTLKADEPKAPAQEAPLAPLAPAPEPAVAAASGPRVPAYQRVGPVAYRDERALDVAPEVPSILDEVSVEKRPRKVGRFDVPVSREKVAFRGEAADSVQSAPVVNPSGASKGSKKKQEREAKRQTASQPIVPVTEESLLAMAKEEQSLIPIRVEGSKAQAHAAPVAPAITPLAPAIAAAAPQVALQPALEPVAPPALVPEGDEEPTTYSGMVALMKARARALKAEGKLDEAVEVVHAFEVSENEGTPLNATREELGLPLRS